jgi:hypothetical protein
VTVGATPRSVFSAPVTFWTDTLAPSSANLNSSAGPPTTTTGPMVTSTAPPVGSSGSERAFTDETWFRRLIRASMSSWTGVTFVPV